VRERGIASAQEVTDDMRKSTATSRSCEMGSHEPGQQVVRATLKALNREKKNAKNRTFTKILSNASHLAFLVIPPFFKS